ncbi:MAG: aminomethyltransferase family protein [Pseudomonadota bacterium]
MLRGPEALDYVDRLVTRNMHKVAVGRVAYAVWCNDDGQVLDDGTLFRLADDDYRLCAQERHLDWLHTNALGFAVTVEEETDAVAALAVQGPTSCAVLRDMGLDGIETLKPFGLREVTLAGRPLLVSRTGYTGDLGYELWCDNDAALDLWDALFEAGRLRGIRAIGSAALETARIEAGFLLADVDFTPAEVTVRAGHTRSPLELGLEWLVHFSKPNFNGRRALLAEANRGPRHRLVKLDIEGNKTACNAYIYNGRRKVVGTVTSAAWSPICKANVALAMLDAPYGEPGDSLYAEIFYQRELKWHRVMARATVVEGAFFDPPRRRLTPPGDF